MICPKCHTQYPDSMQACPGCGQATPQAGPQQNPQGAPQQSMTSTPEGSRAVGTFVLGILSLVIPWAGLVTGIIAIIMGSRGRNDFPRSDPRYSLNYAGWVMGIVGVCLQALRWIW